MTEYLVTIHDAGAHAPVIGEEVYGSLVSSHWYPTLAAAKRAARKVASVIAAPILVEDENRVCVWILE